MPTSGAFPLQYTPVVPNSPPKLPVIPPVPRRADGQYDVDAIRAWFPITANYIYMNHAAVSPLPAPAAQAMIDCIADVSGQGGNNFRGWYACYNAARETAGRTLGAHADDIALIKNTSEGVSTVAYGFPFQPGDNVVSCEGEFPANVRPWKAQAARGVELRAAPLLPNSGGVDPAAIEALCDSRTRVMALSAVEFGSGFAHDLERLGAFCKKRGILLFLDIIQAYGGRGFDAKAHGIGAMAADSHKWMLGPEGIGVLHIDSAWRDRIEPLGAGWFNYDTQGNYLNFAAPRYTSGRKFELGTLNTVGCFGMLASMLMTEAIGLDQIWRHVLALTDHAIERLAPLGYRPFAPRGANSSGIVSFVPPPQVTAEGLLTLVRRLERDHRISVTARSGRLRISPHLYNTLAEVDRLAEALAEDTPAGV